MPNQTSVYRRIAVNTIYIYVKMVIVSIVELITTRYVLLALGASDFGLYSVVGGILALLNFMSAAMYTTTRRYINIEAGKPDGNQNKIFNICLMLHIGFAIFVFVIAESVGMIYILNYLNVPEGKIDDAIFVFQFTAIISAIGIINVPYQALHNAYEKFKIIAIIDIFKSVMKLPLIVLLFLWGVNLLRLYAVGMSIIAGVAFFMYFVSSKIHFEEITKLKWYNDRKLFKEIFIFNTYTSSGASVILVKTNGSNLLINYFFGTIVNSAFAISHQIESYVNLIVLNLSTASAPQITKSYASENYDRSQDLVEKTSRYVILLMTVIVMVVGCNLDFILKIWLSNIPDYTLQLCQWVLVGLLLRSFGVATSTIYFAHGEIRLITIFTILFGSTSIVVIYYLFKIGDPPQYSIIVYIISDMLTKAVNLYVVNRIAHFDVKHYLFSVYKSILLVLLLCGLFYYGQSLIYKEGLIVNMLSLLFSLVVVSSICYYFGINQEERKIIKSQLKSCCRVI